MLARALVIFAVPLVFASNAFSQTPEPFYKGKTISLLIGFGGGGTYDYYGRLVARHLGNQLPGKPNVIVQSMPGAGSFTAANYLYSIAPKNGTVIGIVTQTLALEEKIGTSGVRYKAAEFNWIGRATTINQVTLSSADIKNIDAAKLREVTVATTGAGSPSDSYPKLLNALAGTKFKLIGPYTSSTEGMLAIERGEVDGALTSWNTLKVSKADWLAQKKINILVQYSRSRSVEMPDVPTAVELGTSPEARAILTVAVSGEDIGRSFIAPPGLPLDRVDTLRLGFEQMTKDPDLLAELARSKAEFEPMSGAALQQMVTEVDRVPPELIQKMQAILN